MNHRPPPIAGMRHIALVAKDLSACEAFYVDLLGFRVEWRPDNDNVYLTSGLDNLALHRGDSQGTDSRLDHIGIILNTLEAVDLWFEFLQSQGVKMDTEPRTHRDGARSFYCRDPNGIQVQMIYHPPLAASLSSLA